ncbi:MAG TPA: hypothetical protein ENN51_03040, partial [candidate division WOR-3 bacterium]|nr:hypothetical protein [candidate division WOR-3 bacterium]
MIPATGLPPGFRRRPVPVPVREAAVGLRQELADAGWFEAAVRLDSTPAGAFRLRVEPGSRSLVERWQVVGARAVAAERVQRELSGNVPLAVAVLERAAFRVVSLYEAAGHPLATVNVRAVEPVGPRRYAVTLEIDEGDPVRVERLEFPGAEPISPRVLARIARFRPGPWQPRLVEAWQRNLATSGLVRVEARELVAGAGGYGLRFRVRPERVNRASGAVGYDAAEAELAGFARIQLANIANTGRRLVAAWESFRGRTRYELGYVEPWLFGSALSLHVEARHRSLDTTAARTELELGAGLPIAPELELTFGTGYEQVAGLDPSALARTAWAATGLTYDTRPTPVNPEGGIMAGLRTRAGTRRGRDSSHFVGRIEADAVLAGPRLGPLVPENRFQGRVVETRAALSELELYRLGGAATVRGYREDELTARRVGWWNFELRYPVDPATAVYGFLDAGLAGLPGGRRFLPGYGIGARVGTRIGGFEAG